jgi:hypothetical protein
VETLVLIVCIHNYIQLLRKHSLNLKALITFKAKLKSLLLINFILGLKVQKQTNEFETLNDLKCRLC